MASKGPKTEQGKRIASLNNVIHGLNLGEFLPCKGQRCFYYEICLIKLEKGASFIKQIPYGSPCPQEVFEYHLFKRGFEKTVSQDKWNDETIHEVCLLLVRRERQRKYTCICPELIREVPGYVKGTTRKAPALGWRYRQDITPKLLRLMESILLPTEEPAAELPKAAEV